MNPKLRTFWQEVALTAIPAVIEHVGGAVRDHMHRKAKERFEREMVAMEQAERRREGRAPPSHGHAHRDDTDD